MLPRTALPRNDGDRRRSSSSPSTSRDSRPSSSPRELLRARAPSSAALIQSRFRDAIAERGEDLVRQLLVALLRPRREVLRDVELAERVAEVALLPRRACASSADAARRAVQDRAVEVEVLGVEAAARLGRVRVRELPAQVGLPVVDGCACSDFSTCWKNSGWPTITVSMPVIFPSARCVAPADGRRELADARRAPSRCSS